MSVLNFEAAEEVLHLQYDAEVAGYWVTPEGEVHGPVAEGSA